ncbi:replication-relaxation family protein [Parasphingopyxis sp.]|uniref:replication-relaxation family protein n=1 Tax=Parasphingopyxis sp. TaxID=1920299 RepID=UPI00260D96DB|nr:replication-relaxation family protein [Parasphingopyxis sp.]
MSRALQKPIVAGNIRLTERDKLWIRAVHRFRFITTDQAQLLCGSKSRDKINKRLRQLMAHDYLDRPAIQRAAFGYAKKRHTVHALGQRGAKWLAEHDGAEFPKGKGWRTANNLKSAERLVHQIGVVDTVLHFERAISERAELDLTHQDELLASRDWPAELKPYRLPTRVKQQGRVIDRATDPDYTFVIGRTVSGRRQQSLCFLEWDNSSEDFIKANRLASSIAQKHRCYADAFKRKLHSELYGFRYFRVLFVVNGAGGRVAKMREVCDRVVSDAPKGVFWYTTTAELEANGPLADIWVTGDGKRRSLV